MQTHIRPVCRTPGSLCRLPPRCGRCAIGRLQSRGRPPRSEIARSRGGAATRAGAATMADSRQSEHLGAPRSISGLVAELALAHRPDACSDTSASGQHDNDLWLWLPVFPVRCALVPRASIPSLKCDCPGATNPATLTSRAQVHGHCTTFACLCGTAKEA